MSALWKQVTKSKTNVRNADDPAHEMTINATGQD